MNDEMAIIWVEIGDIAIIQCMDIDLVITHETDIVDPIKNLIKIQLQDNYFWYTDKF